MNKYLLILLLCASSVNAQDVGSKIQDAKNQIEDIKRLVEKKEPQLQFNRYVTPNFEVLSLDDAQGKYVSDNIENIKKWILSRWGLRTIDFPKPCKVICVPNAELYEKLFNKKDPAWQAGTVWLITDGQTWNTKIPVPLTETVLAEFESQFRTKLPQWFHRGTSVLNGRLDDIRTSLGYLNQIDSKTLLTAKSGDKAFDAQAALFCLWVKREYGNKVFIDFLHGAMVNPEQALAVLGLKSFAECDQRLRTFTTKLTSNADLTW